MKTNELNELALVAKADEVAAWELKAHYMPLIEKLAADNWHKMNNEVDFIEDCYRRIDYAIKSFDITRGGIDKKVKAILFQGVAHYCKNRSGKKKRNSSLEQLTNTGAEEGENDTPALQLKDEGVSVEQSALDNIMKEELVERFADNEIERMIVEIATEAEEKINQSELARRLADRAGFSFDKARGRVRAFAVRLQSTGAVLV